MSTTLEKQVEDLQTALDASSETIEQLNAELSERPTKEEHAALDQELSEARAELDGKDAQVADIKDLAEMGKKALQYAREYALGGYVAFEQCSEDSEEYLDYYSELQNDTDFLGIMRAGAGYFRRARKNRTGGRQSSSEYPSVHATDKPRFVGSSAMKRVRS